MQSELSFVDGDFTTCRFDERMSGAAKKRRKKFGLDRNRRKPDSGKARVRCGQGRAQEEAQLVRKEGRKFVRKVEIVRRPGGRLFQGCRATQRNFEEAEKENQRTRIGKGSH